MTVQWCSYIYIYIASIITAVCNNDNVRVLKDLCASLYRAFRNNNWRSSIIASSAVWPLEYSMKSEGSAKMVSRMLYIIYVRYYRV